MINTMSLVRKYLLPYIQYKPIIFTQIAFSSILVNAFTLAVPIFIMNVYDKVISQDSTSTLVALTVGVAIFLIFGHVVQLLRDKIILHTANVVKGEVSSIISSKLARMNSYHYQDKFLIKDALNNLNLVNFLLPATSIMHIIDFPFIIFFILVIGIIGGYLVFIPIIFGLLCLGVSIFSQYFYKEKNVDLDNHYIINNALLNEIISNIDTIKVFSRENFFTKRFYSNLKHSNKVRFKNDNLLNINKILLGFLNLSSTVVIVFFGSLKVITSDLSLGGLIAITIINGRAMSPFTQFSRLMNEESAIKKTLQTLHGFMKIPTEENNSKINKIPEESFNQLKMKNVSFIYPDSERYTLKGINLKIISKEKYLLLGNTGAGKSTLLKIITRMHLEKSGSISLNYADINTINLDAIRGLFSYVPQEPEIFTGSILDNITLFSEAHDLERLNTAIEISRCNQLIDNFNKGINHKLNSEKNILSLGQKQILVLARAIYRDSDIFIMDEPISSIEGSLVSSIVEDLKTYLKSKTVILSTHNVKLAELADNILLLDHGMLKIQDKKSTFLKEKFNNQI